MVTQQPKVAISIVYLSNPTGTMAKTLPTVPRYKTIVNLFKFLDNPIPIIQEALEEYGPSYQVYIGGTLRNIMTTDPDIIQHIMQKNNRNYHKSDLTKKRLGKYLGQGLLTSDGDYWLQQRRLIQPGFHKNRLATLADTMNEEITKYIEELGRRVDEGQNEINATMEMMELTLNIVCKALFGSEIDQSILDEFGHNMHMIQEYLVREVRTPLFGFWRAINGTNKKSQALSDKTNQIVLDFIQKRRQSKAEHDDLLDMLLHSTYEDTGETMNDQQLLDEALILFVAGHETSAVSSAWTLMLLSQHDQVHETLAREYNDQFPEAPPAFAEVRALDYSRQVISESLRRYPPAWIVDRYALADDEASGYHIPKGSTIAAYVYGAHHNPAHWEDAYTFDPSRFEKDKMKDIHPFAYFPFGGGPRLCIGQHFALVEMQLIISRLASQFKFTLLNENVPAVNPLVTLKPKEDIIMHVERLS